MSVLHMAASLVLAAVSLVLVAASLVLVLLVLMAASSLPLCLAAGATAHGFR